MIEIFAVAAGGALGAFARYSLGYLCQSLLNQPRVATGTLLSNLAGCFLGGIALGWITTNGFIETHTALFVTTGFLGSLTTFSTFALEAYGLINRYTIGKLALYLVLQLLAAFALTAAGFQLYNTWGGHG